MQVRKDNSHVVLKKERSEVTPFRSQIVLVNPFKQHIIF